MNEFASNEQVIGCPIILESTTQALAHLKSLTDLSQEEILAKTMVYFPGATLARDLTLAYEQAAKRGVRVHLKADEISRLYLSDKAEKLYWGTAWFDTDARISWKQFQAENDYWINRLKESGVDWQWKNEIRGYRRILPFSRASHSKIFVVDNKEGWGACGFANLYEGGLLARDYGCYSKEPNFVAAFKEVFEAGQYDWVVQLNPDYQFINDGGKVNRFDLCRSDIYKKAIEMAEDESRGIKVISELLPDGKFLDALIYQASHGTEVKVYAQPEGHFIWHTLPWSLAMGRALNRIKHSEIQLIQNYQGHIHAKGIATAAQQASLVTSHNLNFVTGLIGTAENGIYSTDPRLYAQLNGFFNTLKAV